MRTVVTSVATSLLGLLGVVGSVVLFTACPAVASCRKESIQPNEPTRIIDRWPVDSQPSSR